MATHDRSSGPLSHDEFACLLKESIEKAGEKEPIHYNPKDFSLNRKGEGENTLYLTNAYNEYCAASETEKPTVVRNFVRIWFSYRREMPEDLESARHDLLPGIRNRMFFENAVMEMKIGKKEIDWPYCVLGKFLGIGLVYDLPRSMYQILRHQLDQWQTTYEEAYEIACENLREITKHTLKTVAPGVWMSPWRDNYDPSRMLLIDYIRHHDTKGDPVVMVPNRDTLLLTGSKHSAGLTKLVEMAESSYEHPRALSGIAFRLTDEDEWVPFLPSTQHPRYMKYRMLQVKTIGSDYAEQKANLDELHEQTGKDIFVAGFFAISRQDTGIRTYCVWGEGVLAFLPKTDYIYFVRAREGQPGQVAASVPWADAERVLGDRIKPVGIYPERYLVEGFPTEQEIAVLGCH
jgi:hypothetical protein